MSVLGDPKQWQQVVFPEGFIPDILAGVQEAWAKTRLVDKSELETRITKKLKHQMMQNQRLRDLPLRLAREHRIDCPTTGEERGSIDLCLLYDHEDSVYFAFECKRLNVQFKSRKETRAAEYIGSQGMGCFVSGKYAKGHSHGGMIGYVLDGNTEKAISAVSKAISKNSNKLKILENTGLDKSDFFPQDQLVKKTSHDCVKRITLHHVFLAN